MNVIWKDAWLENIPRHMDELEQLQNDLSIQGFFMLRCNNGACLYIGKANNIYDGICDVLRDNEQIRACQQLGHLQILVGIHDVEDENIVNDALRYLVYLYNPRMSTVSFGYVVPPIEVELPAEHLINHYVEAIPYSNEMEGVELLRFEFSFNSWCKLGDYLSREEVNNKSEEEIRRILNDLIR